MDLIYIPRNKGTIGTLLPQKLLVLVPRFVFPCNELIETFLDNKEHDDDLKYVDQVRQNVEQRKKGRTGKKREGGQENAKTEKRRKRSKKKASSSVEKRTKNATYRTNQVKTKFSSPVNNFARNKKNE